MALQFNGIAVLIDDAGRIVETDGQRQIGWLRGSYIHDNDGVIGEIDDLKDVAAGGEKPRLPSDQAGAKATMQRGIVLQMVRGIAFAIL